MKKTGFTLAEVLITLGIIGVVAAMTIPTLIANTNSQKFRSQFKKTVSTMNQAGLMGEAQYDMNYSAADAACGTNAGTDDPDDKSFCGLLNGTLTGHQFLSAVPAGYSPTIKSGVAVKTPIYLTLADGSMVVLPGAAKSGTDDDDNAIASCTLPTGESLQSSSTEGSNWITDHPNCIGYIDVNGKTNPNKEVVCADGTAALTPWVVVKFLTSLLPTFLLGFLSY